MTEILPMRCKNSRQIYHTVTSPLFHKAFCAIVAYTYCTNKLYLWKIDNVFIRPIECKQRRFVVEKHTWPVMVYPNVHCKIKSDSSSKEKKKAIVFNRVLIWKDQKVHGSYVRVYHEICEIVWKKKFFNIHKIS